MHPYDDPLVIAGQGTIALEMLEETPDLDVLVIPVGGGGLIAGNAVAARSMRTSIEIIGAEAALYPAFWNALRGAYLPCGGPTLAEGIAVRNVGTLTLPIVRELVSDIVLVDEAHLERAVNCYLTLQKAMAEGAGAAGLAAMLTEPERFRDRKVGLILCGGNIDPRILASIMVRELEREDRIVSFASPSRTGLASSVRSPPDWVSSARISSPSITAGSFWTCLRKEPSSTSPSRPATRATGAEFFRRSRRKGRRSGVDQHCQHHGLSAVQFWLLIPIYHAAKFTRLRKLGCRPPCPKERWLVPL